MFSRFWNEVVTNYTGDDFTQNMQSSLEIYRFLGRGLGPRRA